MKQENQFVSLSDLFTKPEVNDIINLNSSTKGKARQVNTLQAIYTFLKESGNRRCIGALYFELRFNIAISKKKIIILLLLLFDICIWLQTTFLPRVL